MCETFRCHTFSYHYTMSLIEWKYINLIRKELLLFLKLKCIRANNIWRIELLFFPNFFSRKQRQGIQVRQLHLDHRNKRAEIPAFDSPHRTEYLTALACIYQLTTAKNKQFFEVYSSDHMPEQIKLQYEVYLVSITLNFSAYLWI